MYSQPISCAYFNIGFWTAERSDMGNLARVQMGRRRTRIALASTLMIAPPSSFCFHPMFSRHRFILPCGKSFIQHLHLAFECGDFGVARTPRGGDGAIHAPREGSDV
jgi:hypothetical protein